MPTELILRADAGPGIGAGHVMRSLALAQAWPGPVRLLTADCPAELRERYTSQGFVVEVPPAGWEARLDRESWVVLDGYGYAPDLQQRVLDSGACLLVMDDMVHLPVYRGHLILNQNVGAERLTYPVRGSPLLLLGGRFILLRDEFLVSRQEAGLPEQVEHLLVTLGGSAAPGAYESILEALALVAEKRMKIRLVVPQGARREALLELARRRKLEAEFVDPTPRMPELMTWAHLVVSGAGCTLWELAFLGRPGLPVVLADNQEPLAREMEARGILRSLGQQPDYDPRAMAEVLREALQDGALRRIRVERARKMVDGRGRERVVALMQLLSRNSLKPQDYRLRRATHEDVYDWWRLAEDSVSLSPSSIPLEDQQPWYDRRLASPEHAFFVFDFSGVLGAQIHYQRLNPATAELHFSVSAALRGRGLEAHALAETFERATGDLGVSRIRAHVIAGNQAPFRDFAQAGYSFLQDEQVQGRTCHVFERTLS